MEIISKVSLLRNSPLRNISSVKTASPNFYFREGNFLPVETAGSGCCRYLTVDWINSIMVKAYRNGLSAKDLFQLSNRDEGYFNAERFQRIWEEEVREAKSSKNGPRQPSLAKCVWKFSRTRLILSSIFIMLSIVLQFIAPVRKMIVIYSGCQRRVFYYKNNCENFSITFCYF